jgi:hypothetical protein
MKKVAIKLSRACKWAFVRADCRMHQLQCRRYLMSGPPVSYVRVRENRAHVCIFKQT